MSKEKRELPRYLNVEYESQEELMVLMWLEELMDAGYISRVERAQSLELSKPFVNEWEELVPLKTKVKTVTKRVTILNGHVYTPEFKVHWNDNAFGVIVPYGLDKGKSGVLIADVQVNEGNKTVFSYIEVKPKFDQNNMTRLFKINQKWVWDKHGVFVNLVEPTALMEKTFTPAAWLTTKTGKERKVNWEVRTLKQWLDEMVK